MSATSHRYPDALSISDRRLLETVPLGERRLPMSTPALLAELSDLHGPATALAWLPDATRPEDIRHYSYNDLVASVSRAANAFHRLGLGPGGVVSMLLPNLPEAHFTLWGAQVLGAINPVNPLLEVGHIAGILKAAGTRILVVPARDHDPELWCKVEELASEVGSLEHVLVVSLSGTGEAALPALANGRVKVHDFGEQLAVSESTIGFSRDIAPGDTAALFHTGGTTGRPKLARHSHRNQVACAFQIAACLKGERPPVGLCGLPLFHVNAVFITGLALWMQGGGVLLAGERGYRDPALLANFWEIVERHRVTMFSCVPTILNELARQPMEGRDLSSLEYAVCGAAPLSREMADQFERSTGLILIEGYGQTEGTCASTLNPRYGERRIGSVGLPLPYSGVRVVELDDDKRVCRECAVDEEGSVLIAGPNVFSGYVEEQDNQGIWAEEGWLVTGDLGRLDAAGYLWLTGRSKDLIIRGGHNIDPKMIEEVYYRHPDVAEVAALGRPDRRLGEVPVVCVQPRPGCTPDSEELLAFGRAHIGERAAVPKAVYLFDRLPVTAVGKIFKPDLRLRIVEELVSTEARDVLGAAVDVRALPDKRYGYRVVVTAPDASHGVLRSLLSHYTFFLELRDTDARHGQIGSLSAC